MKIIKLKINDIKPYKGNAKLHPKEQIEQMKNSIRAFGMNDPIAVDENNTVIEGHGRLIALKELDYQEVECIRLSHLTEPMKRAYIIAHNKITLNTGYGLETLESEFDYLEGTDMDIELTGFDRAELDALFSSMEDTAVKEDDFDAEKAAAEIKTPISKRGDIWLLGRHRLMCGDSTVEADVQKLMDGQKVKLIVTDSAYNVDYNNGGNASHPSWKKRDGIKNDNMPSEMFREFLHKAFTCAYNSAIPGAAIYAFMSAQEWGRFMPALEDIGWHWSSTIIWVKDSLVLGRKDWQPRYEGMFYGWRGDAPRLYPLKEDRTQTDVWEFDRPKKNPLHPTQKSLELIGKPIHFSSREGDIVLDLFSGSASTLIAADQLKRTCYTMELDEKFVDVGVKRYYQYSLEHKNSDDGIYLIRDGQKVKHNEVAVS